MKPIILRHVIGAVLRELRAEAGLTLRDVSQASMVSLGYLSEVERGRKEVSSEVLGAIAQALDVQLSTLLGRVAAAVAVAEQDAMTLVA